MEAQDNGNGRVTLAKIDAKLDEIFRRLGSIETKMELFENRLHCDELEASKREMRLKAVEEDVERLTNRDAAGTIAATMAAIIAGVIAWFKT